LRAWKGWKPAAGSTACLRIFSGVRAATSSISVDDHAEVELPGDVAALLHVDLEHLLALGPGLVGDELPAQDARRRGLGLGRAFHHLDTAGLAAAPGVDLGLHHNDRRAEFRGGLLGFLGGGGHDAPGHDHPVLLQNLLGLVLVDVHESSGFARPLGRLAAGQPASRVPSIPPAA